MSGRQDPHLGGVPRIGLVLPYLKSRGTERQTLALGEHLEASGWEVVVFVLEPWGDYRYAFEDAGLEVFFCQVPSDEYPPRNSLRAANILARSIRERPVDLLLSRAGMTNMASAVAGAMTRTPVIVVQSGPVHDATWGRRVRDWLRWRNWTTFGLAARVVTVSTVGAERLRRSWAPFRRKIVPIRNGVRFREVNEAGVGETPIEFERLQTPTTFNVGYVGSLSEHRKGLDVLLEAFARLELDDRDAALWMVGTGDDAGRLRDRAARLGIEDRTHFVGERHDPYVWMKMLDAFILPSRQEGLPNALMEAMALGRCCVASDCPTGPSELIEPGWDGFLVRPGDIEALRSALRSVAEDPERAALFGHRAREKMRREFRSRDSYASYEALCRELLER